jgi:hypothetical protein
MLADHTNQATGSASSSAQQIKKQNLEGRFIRIGDKPALLVVGFNSIDRCHIVERVDGTHFREYQAAAVARGGRV